MYDILHIVFRESLYKLTFEQRPEMSVEMGHGDLWVINSLIEATALAKVLKENKEQCGNQWKQSGMKHKE